MTPEEFNLTFCNNLLEDLGPEGVIIFVVSVTQNQRQDAIHLSVADKAITKKDIAKICRSIMEKYEGEDS